MGFKSRGFRSSQISDAPACFESSIAISIGCSSVRPAPVHSRVESEATNISFFIYKEPIVSFELNFA